MIELMTMVFSRSEVMGNIPIYLFFVLIPYSASLNFSFTKINPQNQNRDIITEGDGAYISDSGIQVTPDQIASTRSVIAGRATYIRPLHLWDNKSGELTDFATDFSFVIDSNSATDYSYGLTFFLAQNNSVITAGEAMGLPVNATTNDMTNPFVAVEFDTYYNSDYDPVDLSFNSLGDHVAIDVNSIRFGSYEKWLNNVTGGSECHAWIRYSSSSYNLSVVVTGIEDGVVVPQVDIHQIIDLRDVLPEWVIFGFSASTGSFFQKNNVKSWTFNSSNIKIDDNNVTPPSKGKIRKRYMVGLIVVLCVTVTSLALLALWVWRKKKKKKKKTNVDETEELELDIEMNKQFEMGIGPKRFSYQELARATCKFAEKTKLGEGGFGKVYKGFLQDSKTYVAVKRMSKSSKQRIKEYTSEVKIISQLKHRKLVQLIGWCHEKGELILVYEFMENQSLDSHLFKAKSLLTWDTRYKIADDLASALLYLHEECDQCVLHRDIKSSNVMLDSNFSAKLGDFGLAKLVDHEKDLQTTMLAGTMGYMAPEYLMTEKASKQSDMFSYGVVALEIACGRKVVEYEVEENKRNLLEWVWGLYGNGTLVDSIDPRIGSDVNKQEIERLMIVGLWCAHPDPDKRPSIRQVIQVLKFDAPLPILPSKMPVATYFARPDDVTSIPHS